VALAPTGGDTVAIVEAKNAAGANVSGAGNLKVDRWGHAVVSSLVPFAANTIDIDPKGLPLNVELKATDQRVVPTAGAVVLAKFETARSGRAAVIRARDSRGEPLPFGVDVIDAAGNNVGVVAQGGRIVALGLKQDHGTLNLRWGDDAASRCQLDYTLPPLDASVPNNRFTVVEAVCR
jgi:outer membrane usher protein